MPFVKVFIKIVHSAASALTQPIDLKISEETICTLSGLMGAILSKIESSPEFN